VLRHVRLSNRSMLILVRSGMGWEHAATASRWLIGQGAAALGVCGICGALSSALSPGDLILADAVMAEKPDACQPVWKEEAGFSERVHRALMERGISARCGPIIGVQTPVLSVQDKISLFAKSKALAADMESAAVASAAHAAGLPFFAFRTVCDPACRSVSQGLFSCIDQKARVRPLRLLRTVLLQPGLISELFQMRQDFDAALAGLRRAWRSGIRDMLPSLLI